MHDSMLRKRAEDFRVNERKGEEERTYCKTDSSESIGEATDQV